MSMLCELYMTYIKKSEKLFFFMSHFKSVVLSSSPREHGMENHISRKIKLVSSGNITNKIQFLGVYGDINLVDT